MGKKHTSIAEFIENLPMDKNVGNCESALLATNMTYMGGNSGNCVNEYAERCDMSVNGGNCKNFKRVCDHSKNNGDCVNSSRECPVKK